MRGMWSRITEVRTLGCRRRAPGAVWRAERVGRGLPPMMELTFCMGLPDIVQLNIEGFTPRMSVCVFQ